MFNPKKSVKLFIILLLVSLFLGSVFAYDNQTLLDQIAVLKEQIKYDQAVTSLKRANLTDSISQQLLARLYYLYGDKRAALDTFNKIKHKDWLTFLYLGLIYEALDQFKEAYSCYEKSLKAKETELVLYRMAKMQYQRKEYALAKELFSRVISNDPSVRTAYYYLAQSLFSLGDYEKAYFYFTKCKGFYPDNTEVLAKFNSVKNNLGTKYFSQAIKEKDVKRKEKNLKAYQPIENVTEVAIGLAQGIKRFSFRCAGEFTITGGDRRQFTVKGDKTFDLVYKNGKFYIYDLDKKVLLYRYQSPIIISSDNNPFYVFDVTYGQGAFWHKKIDRVFRGKLKAVYGSTGITLINILSIEEYLYGVLASEISADYGYQALKAQSVAARTIALRNLNRHKAQGFNFCCDVHCQVYQGMSAEHPLCIKAVDETRGEVLVFNKQPIEAFYHANCGGILRADAFGKKEYLKTQPDSLNLALPNSAWAQEQWLFDWPDAFCGKTANAKFRWQRIYDAQDFALAFGFELKDLVKIMPLQKSSSLRYDQLKVITVDKEELISGDLKIREFFDNLKSSAFVLEIQYDAQKKPKLLIIWGMGFGHGAGLCQEGARTMAEDGFSYKDILKHYYPQAELKKEY